MCTKKYWCGAYSSLHCTVLETVEKSSFHLCSCRNVQITVATVYLLRLGWTLCPASLNVAPWFTTWSTNVVWISLDTVNLALFFHGLQVYLSLPLFLHGLPLSSSLSLFLFLQHCLQDRYTNLLPICSAYTWFVCLQSVIDQINLLEIIYRFTYVCNFEFSEPVHMLKQNFRS